MRRCARTDLKNATAPAGPARSQRRNPLKTTSTPGSNRKKCSSNDNDRSDRNTNAEPRDYVQVLEQHDVVGKKPERPEPIELEEGNDMTAPVKDAESPSRW